MGNVKCVARAKYLSNWQLVIGYWLLAIGYLLMISKNPHCSSGSFFRTEKNGGTAENTK
jgi:hypothetical protein